MGMPTKGELEQALQEAARMREQGQDPHFVAKTLLNTQYRLHHLEQVLKLIESYLNFGQDELVHARLTKAIAEYHHLSDRSAHQEPEGFGLE